MQEIRFKSEERNTINDNNPTKMLETDQEGVHVSRNHITSISNLFIV